MKRIFLSFMALTVLSCQKELSPEQIRQKLYDEKIEVEAPSFEHLKEPVHADIPDVLVALPKYYDSAGKSYPLLISIHTGEAILQPELIIQQGVPKLVADGVFPPSHRLGNETYSFIIVVPHFNTFSQTPTISTLIDWASNKFRIDRKRVYVIGYSMGSVASWNMAVDQRDKIAAVVPMSGIPANSTLFAQMVAGNGVPIWYFHNTNDHLFGIDSVRSFVTKIQNFGPKAEFIYTEGQGGHDSWTRGTDPSFINSGLNIYQWMLKWHK